MDHWTNDGDVRFLRSLEVQTTFYFSLVVL